MPSPTTAVPDVRSGAASAAGRERSHNEDALVCGPIWFAVADGMGGHRAGDVASGVAVEELAATPAPTSVDDVRAVVDRANTRIRAAAAKRSTAGMGATLVAAARMGDDVAVASIGDARCYRMVDGTLTLATRDHSHVQELVDLGRLTLGEAEGHPLRHVVTRALGVDAIARADVSVLRAPVGRLLLCSDGLSVALTPRSIGRVLAGMDDAQAAAERLVQLANGAADDATAVVVDIPDGPV